MAKSFVKASATVALMFGASICHAQVDNVIGSLNASGAIGAATCTVLANDANVKLSNNVSLGYKCSPTYNVVKMASCNSAGSRKAKTVDCKFVEDTSGATEYTPTGSSTPLKGAFYPTGCAAADVEAVPPTKKDISGGTYFIVSTDGGALGSDGAGDGNVTWCSGAVLEAFLAK